jgi:G patch domain-containing protein 1
VAAGFGLGALNDADDDDIDIYDSGFSSDKNRTVYEDPGHEDHYTTIGSRKPRIRTEPINDVRTFNLQVPRS